MKFIYLFISLFILPALPTPAQTTTKAKKILKASQLAYGKLPDDKITSIHYDGVYFKDDHLFDPEELWEYDYEVTMKVHPDLKQFRFTQQFTEKSEKTTKTETMLYLQDQEYVLTKNNEFFSTHPNNNSEQVFNFLCLTPQLLIAHILKYSDEHEFKTDKTKDSYRIHFMSTDKRSWTLTIDKNTKLLQKIEHQYYHSLFGDVKKIIEWKDHKKYATFNFPGRIVTYDKNYLNSAVDVDVKTSLMDSDLPEFKAAPLAGTSKEIVMNHRIVSGDSILMEPIAKDLFAITLPETNNRLLLAEFQDFLVLLEGSYHSKNGDLVMDFLKKKFPGKRVKYWSYSHCHGQYIGFARSIVDAQGIIVTPPGNKDYLEKIINANHTLRPDNLQKSKRDMQVQALEDGRFVIKDDWNQLEVYNIGPNHTKDYQLFYFPIQKIVFVGDICNVQESLEPVKLSERTMTFFKSVTDLKLDFENIYTSWPLRGYYLKSVVPKDLLVKYAEYTAGGVNNQK